MNRNLTVLNGILKDELIQSFFAMHDEATEGAFNAFLQLLYLNNAENDFSDYLKQAVLFDQNAFSVACANHKTPSEYLVNAFCDDVEKIYGMIGATNTKNRFNMGKSFDHAGKNAKAYAEELKNYYAQFGYGDFIRFKAFTFQDGVLRPVTAPSEIQLADLKNYEEEKKVITNNLENFLFGLPHSNMLLYGERGTGKSSTVHAMLNKYYENGLRLVELSKENMLKLNQLKEVLRSVPLKFIVYIDDLSLSAGDERISSLKAALEGCSQGNTNNAMIVATSNRRHIIDEKFSQREDSVHSGDSMQEELSLSDRFGISVLFSSTNKESYLSIIHQLAQDRGMTLPTEELDLLAERWAIMKGGRSPRRAKQFIDLAYSLSSRGLEITF